MSPLDALVEQLADAVANRVAATLADRSEPAAPATPWLDAQRAADYIGGAPVSRIYDLIQTGKLTPNRDGRRVVLHRDDLDAYLRGAS